MAHKEHEKKEHMGGKSNKMRHGGMGKKEAGFGSKLGKSHGGGKMGKMIEGPHK